MRQHCDYHSSEVRSARTLHVGGGMCSVVRSSRVRRTSCLSRLNCRKVESVVAVERKAVVLRWSTRPNWCDERTI